MVFTMKYDPVRHYLTNVSSMNINAVAAEPMHKSLENFQFNYAQDILIPPCHSYYYK